MNLFSNEAILFGSTVEMIVPVVRTVTFINSSNPGATNQVRKFLCCTKHHIVCHYYFHMHNKYLDDSNSNNDNDQSQ